MFTEIYLEPIPDVYVQQNLIMTNVSLIPLFVNNLV